MGRLTTRAALGAALTIGATLGIAAPAAAEPAGDACWVDPRTDAYECFASEAEFEAALAAEGIALVQPPIDAGPLAARAATEVVGAELTAAAAAYYILARFWDGSGYSGASFTHASGASSCASYSISLNMPGDWNDRVSSFQGYSGCRVRLAEHTWQGGALFGPYPGASSIGSMNDRASSFRVLD